MAVLLTEDLSWASVTAETPAQMDKEWTKQAYVQVYISFTSWTNSE